MRFGRLSKIVVVLAALGAASSAQAVPLDGTPLTFTAVGVTVTVSADGCTWTGGSCSDLELLQDGSNLGVTVQASNGTTPLASVTANTDLSFNLNLLSASNPVSGIQVSAVGSGSNATAGASGLVVYPGQSDSLSFSPTDVITIGYDIGPASPFDNTPSDITSVTQDFLVPEPASATLLLASFVSMVALRRRRV